MQSRHRSLAIVSILLVVAVIILYSRTGNFQFVNLDDQSYVTRNPHLDGGLPGENIAWAFTSAYSSNWHPLTWLSHMVDLQLFGMNPRGHHLVNVFFHTFTKPSEVW